MNDSGKCDKCPDFTRPKTQHSYYPISKNCITDQCSSQTQILLADGTCETCGDYTLPDDANRNCILPVCSDNEIMTLEASCESCGDYTHPDDTLKECVSDNCNEK